MKRGKRAEDVTELGRQQEYVRQVEERAKVSWLASHPEEEGAWLARLAAEEVNTVLNCDVCERSVGNRGAMAVHVSEHATCGIDGCTYTAHQDVLEKHIRQ